MKYMERKAVDRVFRDENGAYAMDCRGAVWATNHMHADYQAARLGIKDTDFLIENRDCILMVEYQNASIKNAAKPDAFDPTTDKMVGALCHKFFDSLHYLYLLGKAKPIRLVYVLEYPGGDRVTRKRLRNKLQTGLPFQLQKNLDTGRRLIDSVDVVSIQEWNDNEVFGKYPISEVQNEVEQ